MMPVMLPIPDSLPPQTMELVPREQCSPELLRLSAWSEKVSLRMTDDYLAKRAKRGSRDQFQAVLAKIKSAEPEEFDRL